MDITVYDITADISERLKFAFVSDLHDAENGPVLKLLAAQKPDAVLVGGDFIHDELIYKRGAEFIKSCSAMVPTFCSIGNHERKYNGDISKLIAECGAVALDNSFVRFKDITVGGLSSGCNGERAHGFFRDTPHPQTEWLEKFCSCDGFKILLSHHPEYYKPYLEKLPIELVLSGHAHGGQWRAFGRGLLAPGQGFFPKYTSGIYDGRLIVGRGIGNKSRFPRINNHPEIVIINVGK